MAVDSINSTTALRWLARYRVIAVVRATALLLVLLAGSPVTAAAPAENNKLETPRDREQLVLLHGFGRNAMAMWLLGSRLEDAGYEVHRIGYRSLQTTTDKMVNSVSAKIQHCCGDSSGKIHFVGHSLGGLLIRAYLDLFRRHDIGRVVLIGSPSGGAPMVDEFQDSWWLQLAGEAALDLGTAPDAFANSLKPPYYALGIIAGDSDSEDMQNLDSDASDGMIPVASTVVAGMQDFIVVRGNHSLMRYNRTVADQTIAFLRTGRFER